MKKENMVIFDLTKISENFAKESDKAMRRY